ESKSRPAWRFAIEVSLGGNRSGIGSLPARNATPWWLAGRKPDVQLLGPEGGRPRGSGRTTKAGRSWFSGPRPEESQAPRHGKLFMVKPEFMKNVAGVWLLLLDCIE